MFIFILFYFIFGGAFKAVSSLDKRERNFVADNVKWQTKSQMFLLLLGGRVDEFKSGPLCILKTGNVFAIRMCRDKKLSCDNVMLPPSSGLSSLVAGYGIPQGGPAWR